MHSPRLKRTLNGGPGNHTSILECSCGARFDGTYNYIERDRLMCDWYARHATIAGGGDAVARILRQYDKALDAVNYPDTGWIDGWITVNPTEILDLLRTKVEDARDA